MLHLSLCWRWHLMQSIMCARIYMNLKLNELHDEVNASALTTQATDLEYLKTAGTVQQHCVFIQR